MKINAQVWVIPTPGQKCHDVQTLYDEGINKVKSLNNFVEIMKEPSYLEIKKGVEMKDNIGGLLEPYEHYVVKEVKYTN